MKRISLIYILLFVPLMVMGQNYTSTYNYVSEKIYLDPTTTVSGARSVSNVSYLDGFGRKLQEIAVNASPSGGDIVTPYVYGIFGRTEKEYLPYKRSVATGAYHTSPTASANWTTPYGSTDQAYAYTLSVYDNSPLDRVVKQIGAGQAWQSAGKGVTTAYALNTGNEVKKYRVNDSGTLYLDGYYTAGTLRKITITDEDNNVVFTFADNQDRVLLTISKNGSELLETYNVYDDRGLLRYVLSPEASNQLGTAIDNAILNNYAYRYDYDLRGRLIQKRFPGCDPIYMVYDKKDRMVLSQDGKQRTENANKWSYSLYDKKNRVIEMGEVILTGSTSHSALQTAASASTDYTPSGTRTPLQYTLYDAYTASANVPVHAFTAVSGYYTAYHPLVTGLVTSVKTKVLDTNTWLTTTTYYDDKCRVIQTISDNVQGGKSQLDMAYDFVGNVITQRECHTHNSRTDIVQTTNVYDDRGRLTSSSTALNGGAAATTNYAYDEIGRLKAKTMGSTTETMSYNIRGWLTSKSSTPFTMNLRYQNPTGGTIARWNGNISEWEWKHGTSSSIRYGFTYDAANRLADATSTNGYNEKNITYDRNGNIKTLQRTAASTTVDNLTYSYIGNQLTGLSEAVSGTPTGDVYARGSAAAGIYTYDANGNMISDSRKSLTFNYNFLNLLSEVKSGSTVKAQYTWLADGTKLRVRDAATNGFDYLGSLTYTGGSSGLQLEAAQFAGGTIKVTGANQEINYFLTDHLGSVRAIVDGSGSVKERNDYYAFGAKHVRSDYPQNTNRYDYNGKEEQTIGDLGFLDYGARMYDAALGRWFNMDPLAEKHYTKSPYVYCGNSPVMLVDPDGRDFRLYPEWDDDGNLIGLRIESTIWIIGPRASSELADDLTRYAEDFYKPEVVGGVKITFDIRYVYVDKVPYTSYFSIMGKGKGFQPGDNILEFMDEAVGQTQVENGKYGYIYANDIHKNAIMHETGHLLGLSDRYDKYDEIPSDFHGQPVLSHIGYENDIMGKRASNSNAKLGFDSYNYNFYKDLGNVLPIKVNTRVINGKSKIDFNTKGELITPYEEGGIHQPKYPDRTVLNRRYNYDFITNQW